jgi:DNA invertase Pin-like site-specific DNA recombinase
MLPTAIIYARYSTAEQSRGYSLERQQTLGAQYATDQGWHVEKTITDEGRSAFHGANRLEGSALHQFELEARNGLHRHKVLVVENIDRLSRQGAKAAAQLIWALNEVGVDVATWQDGYVYKSGNNGDLMELFSVIIKAQMAYEESHKTGWPFSLALNSTALLPPTRHARWGTRVLPSVYCSDALSITLLSLSRPFLGSYCGASK